MPLVFFTFSRVPRLLARLTTLNRYFPSWLPPDPLPTPRNPGNTAFWTFVALTYYTTHPEDAPGGGPRRRGAGGVHQARAACRGGAVEPARAGDPLAREGVAAAHHARPHRRGRAPRRGRRRLRGGLWGGASGALAHQVEGNRKAMRAAALQALPADALLPPCGRR
eukprot:1195449-Prorocentrum_minimum.AAC.8